ncbi:hypothetical protein BFP71_04835 [Roseivirga misakiensis]|uniref:Uncharacterized protein n=1 Tax=Roseivirga misakiensis TaxID=1563681 RepID=A0A1E5T6R0_9BACT|nr:hypothetical protein BFP71_04835 [Roseivirga misakiensis]
MKNLGDTIIFSLTVVLFIIGVHLTMTWGIRYAYECFMLSLGLLFLYRYRQTRRKEKEKEEMDTKKKPRSKKTKRR